MTPGFHATCITIEDTGVSLQVGFADREFETTDYLLFQRGHAFDERDKRLGLANVYVERNDQRDGMYGGIARCELLPGKIRVLFDDKGSKVMHGLTEMEITFTASAEKISALSNALRRCFDGFIDYSEDVA
ncbi:MAG TPA: Imm10 family immunity protein [Steroidobacteraceae bacterium]